MLNAEGDSDRRRLSAAEQQISYMATFLSENGTTCSSSNYGYAMMRVDAAGTAGYLTAG